MARLRVFLLGKFCVQSDRQIITGLDSKKVQELLCYLLVFDNRPHMREKLASLLWADSSESRSKQYLRQTLWQLQSAFDECHEPACSLISADSDWLEVNKAVNLWVDIDQLEQAYELAKGSEGFQLTHATARRLMYAAKLYSGDLLENCYQDWCILERERMQNIYLSILDWLMDYCLAQHHYEAGIGYGMQMLRSDIARERTYRKLMRLHYLNNNRSNALRQYYRCKAVLKQEFDVEPADRTIFLYEQIRDGRSILSGPLPEFQLPPQPSPQVDEANINQRLDRITAAMQAAQNQVAKDVEAVRLAISDHH
jgi:DNA-binding SARP family transcriptional activator